MGNLLSLESNTSNALDMTGGDINVKQKLTVSGETVFNKNITLNPNVLINNIDLATVNKDVTALKASGGLVGNFGTNDLSAGNITSSKLLKTSSINVDGDVTSKYISGNSTDGLKLSNGGTTNITYDSTGLINFNNNNKVNFGSNVQINGSGSAVIKGAGDKAFISAASNDANNLYIIAPRNDANTDFDYTKQFQMNKTGDVVVNGGLSANSIKIGTSNLDNTGTLNTNQVKINGTRSGFSTTGDLTANKATLSSLSVGSNINTGKLAMFSTVINVPNNGSTTAVKIGTIEKGSTITNFTFSGKVSDVTGVFGLAMPTITFKVSIGGWQVTTFDVPVGTFSISKDISFAITGILYTSNIQNIMIQSTTANKFICNPLNMVINYMPSTNPSMVFNGDVSGDVGIFNNMRTNVMNTNSNIITSSGGTFTSAGTSGLVIQGNNNWVLGEVQGSISKSNRLCLSLDDKPLVCINPITKNLMDGSKDW